MLIIHIMPNEKFTEGFINFIFHNFNFEEHYFFITGEKCFFKIEEEYLSHIIWISDYKELYTIPSYKKMICDCNKVIFNGVWGSEMVLLHFDRKILRKSYFFFWGSEIYSLENKVSFFDFRKKIKNNIKKYFFKKAAGIITLIAGDYEELCKHIKPQGKHFVARMAMDNGLFEMIEKIKETKKPNIPYMVMLGNSATGSNRHFEMIDFVEKYKGEEVVFLCPLSYGESQYAKEVMRYGKDKLGDKFVPLTDFLSPEKYYTLLNQCCVGIYNNDRQQALGNIYALLYLGSKIYLRTNTAMWDSFTNGHAIVHDVNEIKESSFEQFVSIPAEELSQNNKVAAQYYDNRYGVKEWSAVFEDLQ